MKGKLKVKKKSHFLLIIFLILTTLLILKTLKKVNVKDIKIYGNNLISKEDILANSYLNLPTKLIFVKTKFAEKELKKSLSLENVSITREVLPFGLKIRIKTRIPVAFGERILKGEKISGFIDKDGFFINKNFSDKENLKKLSCEVKGWEEKYKKTISKILNYQKNNDVEFVYISFSPNGFLTLEEKNLKKLLLGLNPKIIESQLRIISNMKNQLKGKNIIDRIDNIDLTDPNNPEIKVFKR